MIFKKIKKETESKPANPNLKKAVITRHRKDKNLCIKCGMDPHDGNCIEIYNIADNRNIEQPKKEMDTDRQKEAILTYRRKKLLCLRCGCENHNGPCTESYLQADNRTEEEKLERPAIVLAPKFKPVSLIETIDAQKNKEINIKLGKTQDIKLQRDYIVVSILKNKNEETILFSCLSLLSMTYKDYIVCIIGDMAKTFTYSDLLKVKKLHNIIQLNNNQQDIINHLYGCKILFSFENDYTDYCQKYGIRVQVLTNGRFPSRLLFK